MPKHPLFFFFAGAGESGKSTVLKQMRLIHASGFKSSEREVFRTVIFSNIISTMQTLLEALEFLDLEFTDPSLQVKEKHKLKHIAVILNLNLRNMYLYLLKLL